MSASLEDCDIVRAAESHVNIEVDGPRHQFSYQANLHIQSVGRDEYLTKQFIWVLISPSVLKSVGPLLDDVFIENVKLLMID